MDSPQFPKWKYEVDCFHSESGIWKWKWMSMIVRFLLDDRCLKLLAQWRVRSGLVMMMISGDTQITVIVCDPYSNQTTNDNNNHNAIEDTENLNEKEEVDFVDIRLWQSQLVQIRTKENGNTTVRVVAVFNRHNRR